MLMRFTRWCALWTRIDRAHKANVPFNDLIPRYREAQRDYHRLPHIDAMFIDFDKFRVSDEAGIMDVNIVEMATWYHDAIYVPREERNEERSANFFRLVSDHAGFEQDFTERVVRAILATKHVCRTDDVDAQVLCDLDLAILGQPRSQFMEYERQIRSEYSWVPPQQFRNRRCEILEGFLNRQPIYSTKFFRRKYEEQAVRNLEFSIEQLSRS